jgi:SAM-dependent methyltransferase
MWRFARGPAKIPPPFVHGGVEHRELASRANHAWLTERAVEVPVARAHLADRRGDRVLEVGNVLGHYGPVAHTVVDRHERAPGVINADVLAFDPAGEYDLIISVSTIEHVGWDEAPRDPTAAARALRHLEGLLAPGGELLVTVPVGYHPAFERFVRSDAAGWDTLTALRADPRTGRWSQVDPDATLGVEYDRLLYTARAVLVGRLRRSDHPASMNVSPSASRLITQPARQTPER